MQNKIPIAVSYGDGIGPEIMQSTLKILDAAGAFLEVHKVELGEELYLHGNPTGMNQASLHTIQHTKALLKAPITVPRGGDFKHTSTVLRATLGLYANILPCISFAPYIETKYPNLNLVIIKYNEENIHNYFEYQQSPNVAHNLRIISKDAAEKIIRHAFEYAIANNRKKVTCLTKDSLPLTDGLFHTIFDLVAKEYATIEHEYFTIETGAANLIYEPTTFDCIVLPSLYSTLLSNIAGQMSGSLKLLPSISIGEKWALFETIHGSSPKSAFQNSANPSALILAAVNMLVHLDQRECGSTIHNAWLKTIEEGIHTPDIFNTTTSKEKAGTKEFTEAIIKRLGQAPTHLKPIFFKKYTPKPFKSTLLSIKRRELVGCDFYIYHRIDSQELILILKSSEVSGLKLAQIKNQGVEVFPNFHPEAAHTEQWCCRFLSESEIIPREAIVQIYQKLIVTLDVVKLENLYTFDGIPAYSL